MTEIKFALLFFFKRFRIPLFPIVLKTYEEYGPGNLLSELMISPSSSIITGFLHLKNASFAFFDAICFMESDWISSKLHLKKPRLIPKESRIDFASLYLWLLDDAKNRSNDFCISSSALNV